MTKFKRNESPIYTDAARKEKQYQFVKFSTNKF